ncbi:MAG: sulfatase-like hydrolase/transferase [Elusimicrobia bacterium]|nr:sulfatase-like hydrolase/transferase [Elusimicrobiota bacterium]
MVKQYIKRIITLNIIFALIMTIYRAIFTFYYSSWSVLSQYAGDLVQAFILGLRYDCAVIAYINSLATLFFAIFWFIGNQKLFVKFVKSLKYYFMIFFGFVVTLLCIDFGFYSYFQNHMNILMFGIFEDDTQALFSTIAENYPVVWVAIGFILIYVFIYFLTKRIIEKNLFGFYFNKTKIYIKIMVVLCFLAVNFMLARGSFGIFPLGVDNAEISANTFINKVAINGIYTLQAAIEARSKEHDRDYIKQMGYSKNDMAQAFADFLNVNVSEIDKTKPENSLFKTTKYNKDIEEIKPNVVFIMMESFGTDLMLHYNSSEFNVLGELKKHLDEDIAFYRFIPANMGTIGSLESAITNIARLPLSHFLCQSKYAYNKYFYTGPIPYKNSGYETAFMYGGNTGWRNCTSYMPNVGFDKVIGEGSMPKEYERNQWGVFDEYLFDYIFKYLDENENRKFVYVMTTSNHPPYSLPNKYEKPYPLDINGQLQKDITGDMTIAKMRFAAYQYSCQKTGEFLTRLKNSKYADNTIVAITGDHNFWSTFNYSAQRVLDKMSVPFYLYVPEKLKPNKKVDTAVVGSHTDILPTLYNLSLSNTSYWATGTDLLSDEAQNNIASDCLGSIMTKDNFVLYDFASGKEKYYTWNKENTREIVPVQENEEHKKMVKHYKSGIAIAQYMLDKPEK